VPFSTLTDPIIDAYNVRLDQVSGAPRWATKQPNTGTWKRLLLTISIVLDHPLVDKTGLTGANYQFDWDNSELIRGPRACAEAAPFHHWN
jgi:hypothetical protein